ncbi:hypothetical protein FOZ60_010337 [Perkinsus olseni]|uniref:Nucleoplasmin-like domain-containing protein n=1 Tax=Perkinsus olseni TaxID=32597 RepID=A0A7J6PBU1_PEROL|nr:hypothetical protein FOZ60_010337 [Perkinsus olseni]
MASPSPRLMKMFFGIALKGGESQTMDEVNADMVHLTQACLVSPKTDSRCEIQVKETEGESFTIAVLSKGSSNALSLDLTFSPADPPTFVNKGKEEVHLTGCYEFYDVEGESDEESEEEESEVDEADMGEALNKQLTEMIKEKAKAQGLEVEDSEDEDEEDAKIEEVEEDEEEEEEEESDVVEPSPKKAESPKKPSPTKAESPKKPSPKKAEASKAEVLDSGRDSCRCVSWGYSVSFRRRESSPPTSLLLRLLNPLRLPRRTATRLRMTMLRVSSTT